MDTFFMILSKLLMVFVVCMVIYLPIASRINKASILKEKNAHLVDVDIDPPEFTLTYVDLDLNLE